MNVELREDLLLPIIIIPATVLIIWFISKKAPKGVGLLAAGVVWFIGKVVAAQPSQSSVTAGGAIVTAAVIGAILGVIDLFSNRNDL